MSAPTGRTDALRLPERQRRRTIVTMATLLMISACSGPLSRGPHDASAAGGDACVDRQYASLQRSLDPQSQQLRRRGDLVTVHWPGDLAFLSRSATVSEGADALLTALAEALNACQGSVVRVTGHTDGTGDNAANLRLSMRRAAAVVASLVGRGVDAERLSATGAGEDRPIATNTTRAGRMLNRRVEIEISPAG